MTRVLNGRWPWQHTLLTLALAVLVLGPAAPVAWAANPPVVTPAAPKPAPPKPAVPKPVTPVKPATPVVQGTTQLAGGVGQVGATYTLFLGTSDAINYTIRTMEYSVGHFFTDEEDHMAPAGAKSLVLHLTIQNPQKVELHISGRSIRFSGVDSKEQAVEGDGAWYDEQGHASINMSLKPGQKIDVYTRILLTSDVSLPKMIVDDRNNTVWRYDLHGKVAPLPAGVVDPASKDGSVALDLPTGKAGVFYPENFDVRLDRAEFVATVPDGLDVPGGSKVLAVYFTLHNPNTVTQSLVPGSAYTFRSSVADQDGLSTDYQQLYLASRDKTLGGDLQAGKDTTARVLFVVDKDVIPKTVQIKMGGGSRPYVITLPDIKSP